MSAFLGTIRLLPGGAANVERVAVVRLGENTAEAARQAAIAVASADAAAASAHFYATRAEAVAALAVGAYFTSAETGTLRMYQRTGTTPFYVDQGDSAAPVSRSLLASTSLGSGASLVALAQAMSLQDAIAWQSPVGVAADWNGTQSVAGTGSDNTTFIQACFNLALANGRAVQIPVGRYRVTSPITIDCSANSTDPINGGITGLSVFGAGAGRTQIVADHNGEAFKYVGGSSAGWHSFVVLQGFSVLKANYNKAAGSKGFSFNAAAFLTTRDFAVEGFEFGIYGIDVLSAAFESGTIRLNDKGFYFAKGTRSYPNSITFRDVRTLNNTTYGGRVLRPSVFRYRGGSLESNGYTGTLADPNSWGIKIEDAGVEAAIGIDADSVYIENNNGKADIWITQTSGVALHNVHGCSFFRIDSARYTTYDILLEATTDSALAIAGNGFHDTGTYTSNSARPFIGAGNCQVLDGGGNKFWDSSGGFTGLLSEVFAPINVHHQIQHSALPDAAKNRNGIIYSQDGGGGSARPALMVSDGTKWWPMVLGQFAGSVQSTGSANALPRGWSVSKSSTGIYVVTHNLNITGTQYSVSLTRTGLPANGRPDGVSKSNNSFECYMVDSSGSLADRAFDFQLSII